MFFANSNIDTRDEFERRLGEARKLAAAEGVELVDDQLYWTETEGERTLECALTIQPLDGAEYSVWSCHRLITDLSEEDAWN